MYYLYYKNKHLKDKILFFKEKIKLFTLKIKRNKGEYWKDPTAKNPLPYGSQPIKNFYVDLQNMTSSKHCMSILNDFDQDFDQFGYKKETYCST